MTLTVKLCQELAACGVRKMYVEEKALVEFAHHLGGMYEQYMEEPIPQCVGVVQGIEFYYA